MPLGTHKPKVRIVSDGTPWGCKVTDAETGENIDGVKSVEIAIGAQGKTEITLVLLAAEFEAVGDVARIKRLYPCPHCGDHIAEDECPDSAQPS